jgi:ribosomal protein S18 acetylase RimI-like enzyme
MDNRSERLRSGKISMPAISIHLREGTPQDAAPLSEFGARAFSQAFGPDNTPEDMGRYLSDNFSLGVITDQLADPASTFLLAESGDRIVGYVMLRDGEVPPQVRGPEPIELVRIYADPDAIGTGIGSRLMQACLDAARGIGRRTVWLGVWEHNRRAIAFYDRWGFVRVGEKPFTLGEDVQTDHVMEKRL